MNAANVYQFLFILDKNVPEDGSRTVVAACGSPKSAQARMLHLARARKLCAPVTWERTWGVMVFNDGDVDLVLKPFGSGDANYGRARFIAGAILPVGAARKTDTEFLLDRIALEFSATVIPRMLGTTSEEQYTRVSVPVFEAALRATTVIPEKVAQVREQVLACETVVNGAIASVLVRDDKLNTLEADTAALRNAATTFETKSQRLRAHIRSRNMRTICVIGAAIFGAVIVIAVIVAVVAASA
jgi:hypothetical protein